MFMSQIKKMHLYLFTVYFLSLSLSHTHTHTHTLLTHSLPLKSKETGKYVYSLLHVHTSPDILQWSGRKWGFILTGLVIPYNERNKDWEGGFVTLHSAAVSREYLLECCHAYITIVCEISLLLWNFREIGVRWRKDPVNSFSRTV